MRARALALLVVFAVATRTAGAQAPFVTDDASLAPYRTWHLEVYEQFASLGVRDRPALRQNALVLSVMRGILPGVEFGVDIPLLHIENSGTANALGIGDLNFVAKFRFADADSSGWRPALYGSVQVEAPTGDPSQQLGTGEVDAVVTVIAERTLASGLILRGNLGAVLLGNSLTGVVGLQRSGTIVVTSGALGIPVHPRFLLLLEGSFAQARFSDDRDRETRLQVGGWWRVGARSQLGLAYQRGWQATPPHQFQLGWSVDL